jgi:hypothetical protein
LPEDPSELIWLARRELKDENPEQALKLIHQILDTGAKNPEAQTLLAQAEAQFIKKFYAELSPKSVPQIIMSSDGLTQQVLGPREAFVLSRINGEWDLESILSICPFSEVDCLRMIKALLDAKVIGF